MCEEDERSYLTFEDIEDIRKHDETKDPIAKLFLIKPRTIENME